MMKRPKALGGRFVVLVASLIMLLGVEQGLAGVHKQVAEHSGPSLVQSFTAQPITPPLPNHVWMDVGDGQWRFLHFDKPVSDPEARLIFIGEAVKGRFCSVDQPDKGKTGFVHFHRLVKPDVHEHGHGGLVGEDGLWLRHIAVGEFDMMNMHFTPGIAHNFMGTPPPFCP